MKSEIDERLVRTARALERIRGIDPLEYDLIVPPPEPTTCPCCQQRLRELFLFWPTTS